MAIEVSVVPQSWFPACKEHTPLKELSDIVPIQKGSRLSDVEYGWILWETEYICAAIKVS
jgi:hypothetical protein